MGFDPRRIPDLAGRVNGLGLVAAALGGSILTMGFCLLTAPGSSPEHFVIEHADAVHTDSLLSSYLTEARENRRHGRTSRRKQNR